MEWQRNGHGRMAIVGDQKEFFSYTKSSARVVCLFTRESNRRAFALARAAALSVALLLTLSLSPPRRRHGKILTEHLSMLAQRHLEARFICVDAEKAPFITEKLNIWMLPTIVCLKDNKARQRVRVAHSELGRPPGDTAAAAPAGAQAAQRAGRD